MFSIHKKGALETALEKGFNQICCLGMDGRNGRARPPNPPPPPTHQKKQKENKIK